MTSSISSSAIFVYDMPLEAHEKYALTQQYIEATKSTLPDPHPTIYAQPLSVSSIKCSCLESIPVCDKRPGSSWAHFSQTPSPTTHPSALWSWTFFQKMQETKERLDTASVFNQAIQTLFSTLEEQGVLYKWLESQRLSIQKP